MYKTYKYFLESLFLATLILSCPVSFGVTTDSQDMRMLTTQAENYLKLKFGNTADTKVQVQVPEENLTLVACKKLDFFTSSSNPGTNGNLRLSAKCFSPQAWTIYLNAHVAQKRIYFVNKARLEAGHIIQESDLLAQKEFPEYLPFGAIHDTQQILGKAVINTIEIGTPMLGTGLKNEFIINAGQMVKISIGGTGFKINSEGKALSHATLGQTVQVRMASGQTVSGIARVGGVIEVMK